MVLFAEFLKKLAMLVATSCLIPLAAQAAEIKTVGHLITLDGPIVPGDAEKLVNQVYEAQQTGSPDITLSLNSDGGNFSEGLKASQLLEKLNVPTLVKKGKRCNSACALIFLAGTAKEEDEGDKLISRQLEPGAELGFHAPYVNESVGEKSVNVAELTRALTEQHNKLNQYFRKLEIPDSIRPLLMQNDASHSLYDATSMEAIELLNITVVGEVENLQHVTRSMVQNACLNGYRLVQNELPSAKRKSDIIAYKELSTKYGIIMPNKDRNFALIPAVRQASGDTAVCKVDVGGICQNFYEITILQDPDGVDGDIRGMNECARSESNNRLVPPETRLANLAGTLRNMQTQEPMFLRAIDDILQDDSSGNELINPPEQKDSSSRVICNLRGNQSFANVRRGPSGKEALVVSLPNQTKVREIGEAKNPESGHIWKKVSFSGGEGFVDNELVATDCFSAMKQPEQVVPPATPVPNTPPPSAQRVVTVCNAAGDSVNVRSYPDPEQSTVIDKRYNHEQLLVIGETNNPRTGHLYFKVQSGNNVGYVFNEMVSVSCGLPRGNATPAPQQQAGGVKYFDAPIQAVICNGSYHTTNMRAEPIPGQANILRELANRASVMVLGEAQNPQSGHPWYLIHASGLEGYVSSENVAQECVEKEQQASSDFVICNAKSDVSNLRAGPSASLYGIIKVLSNRTPVQVLETARNPESDHLWLKVRARGTVGFVDSDWVKQGC